jgi:hypothetical protein
MKQFGAIIIAVCLSFAAGTYFMEHIASTKSETLVVEAGPIEYAHLLHNNLGSGYVLVELGIDDGEYLTTYVVRMTRYEYVALMNNPDGK